MELLTDYPKELKRVWNVLGEGALTYSSGAIDASSLEAALGGPDLSASPLGWRELALCAQTDPEAFYPEKGGSTREAKKICESCEVRAECLDFALANDERFGIWGGFSERERRRLKQRRTAGS